MDKRLLEYKNIAPIYYIYKDGRVKNIETLNFMSPINNGTAYVLQTKQGRQTTVRKNVLMDWCFNIGLVVKSPSRYGYKKLEYPGVAKDRYYINKKGNIIDTSICKELCKYKNENIQIRLFINGRYSEKVLARVLIYNYGEDQDKFNVIRNSHKIVYADNNMHNISLDNLSVVARGKNDIAPKEDMVGTDRPHTKHDIETYCKILEIVKDPYFAYMEISGEKDIKSNIKLYMCIRRLFFRDTHKDIVKNYKW